MANTEQPGIDSRYEFQRAALDGDIDKVREFLTAGQDANAQTPEGHTALLGASFIGRLDIMQLLLDAGADVSLTTDQDSTALDYAVTSSQVEAVRLLMEHGAKARPTSLHGAVEQGSEAMVKLLLEHGADVNAVDEDGRTPLAWAEFLGQDEIAEVLREAGGVLTKDRPDWMLREDE